MVHLVAIWMLVAALAGAGVVNLLTASRSGEDYLRWGYPRWWGVITGGLEVGSAALIAYPDTRILGLGCGAGIVIAAVVTVLRHHEPSHLAPLSVFVTLFGLVLISG